MPALNSAARRLAYLAIAAAVLIGIAGYVRICAIIVALSTAAIALDSRSQRKIEMYLPLAIAVALLALAIALPRGL